MFMEEFVFCCFFVIVFELTLFKRNTNSNLKIILETVKSIKCQFFFLPKFGCTSDCLCSSSRLKSNPANYFSNLLSKSMSVETRELIGSTYLIEYVPW